MPTPILATKLYSPPPRPQFVLRPRLLARLNEGLRRKLTLISAPAGFGKTTLISGWIKQKDEGGRMQDEGEDNLHPASCILHPFQIAWLSLDAGDSDPIRFLVYLVAALQTVEPAVGTGVAAALQSSQPPPPETLLTALINELTTLSAPLVLVLDDYHLVDAGGPLGAVDQALAFLIEHLPPQMHLLIATREDPQLPLARLRVQGQLCEVRAADLRFTPAEATEFFNRMLGLPLAPAVITALEQRTEGWIAGLQLAALSLQGYDPKEVGNFIQSFTGSHRFIMDYLVEEVLYQQSTEVQTFLLRTSILERFCAPLCDAVLGKDEGGRMKDEILSSSFILDHLERANLFLVPLDNERRWYRYHHLFADLLRQRLHQSVGAAIGSGHVAEYHIRASIWYEANGLEIDAFHHAVAADDVARAARLVEGNGMPLHFRGAQMPVLKWLETLPPSVLDANPALWVIYASVLLFAGKNSNIEQKLHAAERVLAQAAAEPAAEAKRRDLIGHIASIRAFLAIAQNQVDEIAAQSQRALDHLHPDNLPVRTAATWSLGYAYQLQGNFAAARQAHQQAIAISQRIGHTIIQTAASIGLAQIQELAGELPQAVATFQSTVQAAGSPPLLVACEAYLGLARIFYEWNDLAAAETAADQGLQLSAQIELISTLAACQVMLARLKLAHGDLAGAAALLTTAERFVHQNHFPNQLPGIVAAQTLLLLRQQNITAAVHLAQQHNLPRSQAQVALAQGHPAAALALLEPLDREAAATGRLTERLNILALQVLAHQAQGDHQRALNLLRETLTLAEPGGFIRLFVDHGLAMLELLTRLRAEGWGPRAYITNVLAAFPPFPDAQPHPTTQPSAPIPHPSALSLQPLPEPLSEREMEVLHLIAQGLSNQEIGARLFLALDTVKGHNRRIFAKLQVQRRTEAIAKARELKLLREL